MGDDDGESPRAKLVCGGHKAGVEPPERRLEQQPSPLWRSLGDRLELRCGETLDDLVRELSARQHVKPDPLASQPIDELADKNRNLGGIGHVLSAHMRSRHYRPGPVGHGSGRQRKAVLDASRTVVDAGEQMEVDLHVTQRPHDSPRGRGSRDDLVKPSRIFVTAAVLATAALMLVGCGSAGSDLPVQTRPSPKARTAGGPPTHIAVIVMENEEYGEIVGSRATPFINGLARRYALATSMYAIGHPSLPNYLALTGGSAHGIDSDCTDCTVPGTGLAGQLSASHLAWKAYMEDLPHPCFQGAGAGGYAKKHDPFIYYTAIAKATALCNRIVPLTELAADERTHNLPRLIWITPNLCHDMHDCDPAVGDRFLAQTIPPLLSELGPRGVLLLTWDEGSSDAGCCRLASGGHVATIVAGPGASPGARSSTPVDHYSVLQTIEDLLGLPRLGGAGCACTPSLEPLLRRR